jgi:hypothetical protein
MSLTPEQQIEQINITLEEAKENIAMRDALLRLTENKDFKKVIDTGFFEKEAARLVWLKSDPATYDKEESILKQIDAVGGLRQYFRKILNLGNLAEKAIIESEHTIDDIVTEIDQAS